MKNIFFLIALSSTLSLGAQESISLDLATTEEDRKELGIDSMTPSKKAALEQWLGSWTKRVIEAAPSYHPALTLNQWVRSWPKYLQVNVPVEDKEALIEEQKDLATIFRNIDGERITLNNGSEWEIDPPDRFNTRFWTRDTKIEITRNPSNPDDISRPYLLRNPKTQEVAGAKKIQGPSTPPQDSPSYFRGTFQLHGKSQNGDTVRLMNNSIWTIAPVDQQKVSSTWKVHDRIRIQDSEDAIYPYTLNNLDSGSTALAMKKESENS